MSRRPISRSADLRRLRAEGFEIDVVQGYLVVRQIPYLADGQVVARGTFVSKLDLSSDVTVAPSDHVMYFSGEYPRRSNGSPIEEIRHKSSNQTLGAVEVHHSFSSKPLRGSYLDYHEKVTTYAAILAAPAASLEPGATPHVFPAVPSDEDDDSPFRYVDTASSRAEIDAVSKKLDGHRIGILGLGGTGSYVLDLVAKTPVAEIHLFDGDTMLQHNAFRSPGAPSLEELAAQIPKVDHFAGIYSRMHSGVVPHAHYIDDSNRSLLEALDFAFLCLDDNEARGAIAGHLVQLATPFVDVGMGVDQDDAHCLGGVLRVTTFSPGNEDHLASRLPTQSPGVDADYTTNIQIADLNALNAALAVIRWKKHFGFYRDQEHEHHTMYTVDGNVLTNEDRGAGP
jgi:molybdopterin/thiamine biosynthesis adenylyltransferase